jgi:uncharacterized protein YyaL (SSP411 family)
MALLFAESGSKEVVIVTDKITEEAGEMIRFLQEEFSPFTLSLVYSRDNETIKELAPFISEYQPVNGKPTAYICENFSCQAPITDCELLEKSLQS